ncbi:MAG: AAA family ATPase [Chloroflexi bacterium]|nr:AAA family ATPase [Ardenticatenaceae bacterium]MBL1127681.1 chromosome segregation protein SMC [Chloroflexota bacterium]NOG33746.1 AAA family ATPase [Chloroflexota bacterium]GIK56067.1 MAG: chromosome segregation protein SMC [Chloroflexota bacterium]
MKQQLTKITIKGFKTIESLVDFAPGSLTVLVGPNGAGKSNFISFFRLLSWSLTSQGGLQVHVGESGGSSQLLYDGPEKTREIEVGLTVQTDLGENEYAFRLVYAAGDTFIFATEQYRFSGKQFSQKARWIELGAGHRESKLQEQADKGDKTASVVLGLLRKIIVHQFHNTSATSRIRQKWSLQDSRWLKEDGANLAPFLYRLQQQTPSYYRRIVDTIRLILPFFDDFELEPEFGFILLRWREKGSDRLFDVSQAADGMLRAMVLTALLLQPEQDLPGVLILDEPELGLHPYAINILGGMISSISTQVQVIVATQSVTLIDCFEPEDIVVVERQERASTFHRLSTNELATWLEMYSLSELWQKNVFGGRPL